MEQRVSIVTLGVENLDRSRRFYEDGLGWKRGNHHEEIVFYQVGGSILTLFGRAALAEDACISNPGSGYGGVTLAFCTRTRAEVDAVIAQAVAAGAALLKPAANTFWGGYSGYFSDPDGHVWEVAWNPDWELGPNGEALLPQRP